MIGPDYSRHGFNVDEHLRTPATMPPFMTYGMYPKANTVSSGFGNQHLAAALNPDAFPHHCLHSYPAALFGGRLGGGQEENETEILIEVHENHLRAPITVRPSVVYPSVGSRTLFSGKQENTGAGGRNSARICEQFQAGRCLLEEGCSDIHVDREYLIATRQAMISWLQNRECEFQHTLAQDPGKLFRIFCADLKEVVEVPISAIRFTKGLCVDPSLRARRARSAHQNQYAMMALQVPTACGLFSVDPSQCKWGRWCNQVHIEWKWMHSKRNEFESWSNNLEKCFNDLPPNHLFTVHDPQLKTSLSLPKASIAAFSRGLFQGSAKKAPSICMLFQRNKCTASSCCNQIHVVPPYLFLHRRWVQSNENVSDEERRDLVAQMETMLGSLSMQSGKVSYDFFAQPKELNPQARPYIPTPPPKDISTPTTGGEERKMDNAKRKQEDHHYNYQRQQQQQRQPQQKQGQVSTQRQQLSWPSIEAPSLWEQGRYNMNVGLPSHLSFNQPQPHLMLRQNHHQQQQEQQQQQQQHKQRITVSSANEVGGNTNTSNNGNTPAGCVMPLDEFVVVADNDEPSQSSLQASQSNISHMGRSYKHTNNPYTLGGNVSCTASPSFGWVQPVRSAGNSVTAAPTGSVEAEVGGGYSANCMGGGRKRVESSPGLWEKRPSPVGIQQHDFDASLYISSPLSLQWGNSGIMVTKNLEELPKIIPDMDSSLMGNTSFSGKF